MVKVKIKWFNTVWYGSVHLGKVRNCLVGTGPEGSVRNCIVGTAPDVPVLYGLVGTGPD